MNEKKDIETTNTNGNPHGYQEWYAENKLWIRGLVKHGNVLGYYENHYVKHTRFQIN